MKHTDSTDKAGIAWLPLLLAITLTLALTVSPRLLAHADGSANHAAAVSAMFAISAGFVRGVGFIPLHPLPRWLLSTPACLLGIVIAGVLLWQH